MTAQEQWREELPVERFAVSCVDCGEVYGDNDSEWEAYIGAQVVGWTVVPGWGLRCPGHVRRGPYWASWTCPTCGGLGFRPTARAWLTFADYTFGGLAYAVMWAVDPGDPDDGWLYRLRDSPAWLPLWQPLLRGTDRVQRWKWRVAWALEDAADRRAGLQVVA